MPTLTQYQVTAVIIGMTRLRNSVSGNPRYECILHICDPGRNCDGRYLTGKTASDHQFVYNMPRVDDTVRVTYHRTVKRGSIRFTDMARV